MDNKSDSDSLIDTNENTFEIDFLSDKNDAEFEMEDLSIKNNAADQHASVTKNIEKQNTYLWSANIDPFVPKITFPSPNNPIILAELNRSSTELQTFFKLFPENLIEDIANYTNMR